MSVTAARPLDSLVLSLARSHWGPLRDEVQGCRTVLNALVTLLDHRSGSGKVSLNQISDAAGGLSTRWVSRCLARLEQLGLVKWVRGWIDDGRPRPGWVRVHKSALVELIRLARRDGRSDQRTRARADARAGRVALLPTGTVRAPRRRSPLSDRPELSSALSPYRELSPAAQAPPAAMCGVCSLPKHLHDAHQRLVAPDEGHVWTLFGSLFGPRP